MYVVLFLATQSDSNLREGIRAFLLRYRLRLVQSSLEVTKVEDMSDVPASEYPEIFNNVGLKLQQWRPYDLSEPERKEWRDKYSRNRNTPGNKH